jgi:phosphatidylserine/phosphatidylglycerophosphate/cardiolipin synthase-like enzyme
MDTRSMLHNQEFNLHVDDPEFAESVRKQFFNTDFGGFAKSTVDETLPWYKKLVAPALERFRGFL